MERKPPPTRRLHTIERLQAWSILGYYPLEHVYYLLTHSLIPEKLSLPSVATKLRVADQKAGEDKVTLNAGGISRLSTRFWAVYVFLQLLHLSEDRKLLKARERALSTSKVCRTA